jgi:hypothetical protein
MKQSKRIALCGMLTALAVVVMLMAYFPYLTFALPVIAGGLLAIIMFEINSKWALGGFFASAILSLLFCEKEAAMLFVAFFGYYPIVKSFLERISSRILEYILKFSVFNIAIIGAYLVIIFVFGIPMEGMGDFGKYTVVILLVLVNIMFLIYDWALSVMYVDYMKRLHPRVAHMLK